MRPERVLRFVLVSGAPCIRRGKAGLVPARLALAQDFHHPEQLAPEAVRVAPPADQGSDMFLSG